MAPKKDKDPSALIATLVALPHEEQVDLLAQALLREYMHRKHYVSTLKVFDEENPRDDRTISSRALMSELMYVSPAQAAHLKERGVETIMEMLCSMRVEKATTVEERWAELHKILDTQPPQVPQSYFDELRSLEEEIAKTKKRIKKAKRIAASNNAADTSLEPSSEKKKKKKKMMSIDDLLDQDDSEKIKKLKRKQKAVAAQKPTPEPSSDVRQSTKLSPEAAAASPPVSSQNNNPQQHDSSSNDSSSSSSSSSESEDDYASSLRKIKEEEQRMLDARSSMKGGWDIVPSDSADVDAPHETPRRARSIESADPHASPQHSVSHGSPQQQQQHGGYETIGRSLAEQLKIALVGSDRRIPSSFWNQGFYFSKDVTYGLLQNEGGCCGVLAVVQAHIVADIFGNHRLLTENVKRAALVQSFLTILQLIEPNVKKIVVVHPHSGQSHDSCASGLSVKDQLASMSTFVKATNFSSLSEVESYLAEHALKPWVEPKGRGMLCWMLSCVLTRTICAAQRDMDVESPLIVEHGYCSQELVNLLLCGRCTSNVHNGDVQHGDLLLKGIPAALHVGFLSYMEHRQLIHVGSFGKNPRHPAWVVNHESHYTTLFMKDNARESIQEAALTDFVPPVAFQLFFWDQLGGHDEEIRLTVTLEKTPVPPVGKDVIVPYLNDIIRTVPEWKTARVGWNGTDPLL